MIDFHGSTGYGQAFTDSISQRLGRQAAGRSAERLGRRSEEIHFLDGERACALGGSYGGYMVNWIAGNWPEPWKCLVNHAGVFDTRMMGYTTEELWFTEWENGGTPIRVPENYRAVQSGQSCRQMAGADAGGPRPARLPHSGRAGHCQLSPPCSARASKASCCISPMRTTGFSNRRTACCGTIRSTPG